MQHPSKLYKLKTWLTLDQAASALSSVLSEEVTVADILQLALEGHLILSVDFVDYAYVKKGNIVQTNNTSDDRELIVELTFSSNEDVDHMMIEARQEISRAISMGELKTIDSGFKVDSDRSVTFPGRAFPIKGLRDLPLIGNERRLVLNLYQQVTQGVETETTNLAGVQLLDDEGHYLSLQQRRKTSNRSSEEDLFLPAESLPKKSRVVIRRKNLDLFLESLQEEGPTDAGLSDNETDRLLAVLGLLLDTYSNQRGPAYRHGGKPNKNKITDDMLAGVPEKVWGLGERTIKKVLSEAMNAFESKKDS